MGFFDNAAGSADTQNVNASVADLNKALAAGYGSDPQNFTDGRVLIPEDLESTLVNVLDVMQNECKMFAELHKQPIKSTVHEIARRTGVGDDRFNFVAEGASAVEDKQSLERKLFETKYLMTKGSVTMQMRKVNTLEDAYNSEKVAAVTRLVRNAEYAIFHGNSAAVPTQFDGFEKALTETNSSVYDLHGLELGEETTDAELTIKDSGEELLDDIATDVFNKGGDLDRALFPPILAKQFKRMYQDRLRFGTKDTQFAFDRLPDIITATGSSIRIQGKDAGADKMYKVKGVVNAAGNATKRPSAPATVVVSAATGTSGSKFFTNDAGVYKYAVHAINEYGISAATEASASATVANGGSVEITITPNASGATPTGFIITRTSKNGSVLMEMVTIAKSDDATTVYVDKNEDLPGTASMILLTSAKTEPIVSWGQLMPMSTLPLPMDDSGAYPFLVALFGMLEIRAPEFCAKVKNIGYHGGLY